MRSFHESLKVVVAGYKRLLRGEFDELQKFEGLGRLLFALRISQGLTTFTHLQCMAHQFCQHSSSYKEHLAQMVTEPGPKRRRTGQVLCNQVHYYID